MSERDPALERAWRAQSREAPPPELDRAILAAAHRAVGSGPQDAGKTPAATRPQRWWMPLAAAATIGVVAIGVMQSLPDEQLVSTPPERAAAMKNERRIEDKVAAPAPAQSAAKPQEEIAQKEKQDVPAAAPVPTPSPRRDAVLAEKGRANVSGKLASAPEPFPASPAAPKTELDSAKVAPPAGASGGAPADAVAPVPKAAPAMEMQERKDAGLLRQQEPAAAKAPAAPPPPPAQAAAGSVSSFAQAPASPPTTRPMAPSPPAMMAKRARESSDTRSETSAVEANEPAKNLADADEYRAKARDPDAWIVQIRKLRDEGRTADALRELREFRARVTDAEKRLPADLRDWSGALVK